jgi:hypothetical protein
MAGTVATDQMRAGARPRCRPFPTEVCMATELS